jgi:hypothetical protein
VLCEQLARNRTPKRLFFLRPKLSAPYATMLGRDITLAVAGGARKMPDKERPKVQIRRNDTLVNLTGDEFATIRKTVFDAIGYAEDVQNVESILLNNTDRPKPEYREPNIVYKMGCFFIAALVVVISISGLLKIGELIFR